ncbi:ABC transporter substrate-binding protein [Clostridium sp.]|uniref:ABC transporter substrate-binding protein n=1 Tax=Clostridium sp. TaxID=1506 RepID=UPI002A90D9CC|nr:ABC transporter substrate-binding protein [Clostridium sp.]MDY6012669.1 ABC transporter substrate-binding protein [Clostridium sp.]
MKRKIIPVLIFICFCSFLIGCRNKKNNDIKEVNLYYNTQSVKSISYVSDLIKRYEEKQGGKINIIPVNDVSEIEKHIDAKKDSFLVLLDGYDFIDYKNKNYLRDLSFLFKEKSIKEKFIDINNLYGIHEGKYYGLGLTPYSLSLLYNKEALKDLGIEIKENNYIEILTKLREKNIKIPTHIKSEYSKELLFSCLIANDTINYDLYKTDKINKLSEKINNIENGQKIFDVMHDLYNKNILREDMFLEDNKSAIKDFNEGKIPVLLTTTLSAQDITNKEGIDIVDKMPIQNKIVNTNVGMDVTLCSVIGTTNIDHVDNFLRFLIEENPFEVLSKKNCITGNIEADSNLKGVQIKMANDIASADEINKFYINIISNEDISKIDKECKKVLSGKYDGKEWSRVLEK